VTSQKILKVKKTKKVFMTTFLAHHISGPKEKGRKE
jgi:hypothetical protein